MALKIARGRSLPIGLDLGSSSVKMIQLRLTDENVELVASGAANLPPSALTDPRKRTACQTKAIRDIMKDATFRGRACVMSIPADTTHVQHVRLPKTPKNQVEAAIRQELEGKTPFSLANAVLRHVVVGEAFHEGQARQELIAVAVSRDTLQAHLAAAHKAKLDVIGVNIEPCAIVECFARLFRRATDAARTILYIDIGSMSTQVVLSQGNRITFARNLRTGGVMIDQAVAAGLDVPVDQARMVRMQLARGETPEGIEAGQVTEAMGGILDTLADELTQCLRYFESVFRGQVIERAIFLGGQAFDKGLCQAIAKRLNVPAQIGDPLVRIHQASDTSSSLQLGQGNPQPQWAVAVGLSLGAGEAA